MGYAHYTLPDGREAGYGVEATCDKDGCETDIDRGLGYLCGENPDGWRSEDEPGCGKYYCGPHQSDHECPDKECGKYSADGNLYCGRIEAHEGPHREPEGDEFVRTEGDEETLLEDTDPDTIFNVRLSVREAVDVIEDALLNDSMDDFKSLALNIFGLLIDATSHDAVVAALGGEA